MKRDRVYFAITNDTARHNDAPRPSNVKLRPGWLTVMQAILKMPVPRRDEPAAVSGEIRAAR